MMQKKLKKAFLPLFVLIFSLLIGQSVIAGSATISWNANTESDLAGYKIYYGTSARTGTNPGNGAYAPLPKCGLCGYSTSVGVGNVTTYTINNLTNNTTYYFSVSAYDTASPANESAFSSQVSKVISACKTRNLGGACNVVDIVDLGIFLSNWGSTARPAADYDQNGIVNIIDLGMLLSDWGTL